MKTPVIRGRALAAVDRAETAGSPLTSKSKVGFRAALDKLRDAPAATRAGRSRRVPPDRPATPVASASFSLSSSPASDATSGVPPAGLIKIGPGKWYDPRTREVWLSTDQGWQNQGVAEAPPATVTVAPGMEVPFALYLSARYWGTPTIPGVGFMLGGQLVRGDEYQWRRNPTQEELAFGQALMQADIDPRFKPHDPNPRAYFKDKQLYWDLIQSRGVPTTPQEAAEFWWEYQWREWAKKVEYAQAVGMDPSIYPPPDRWSEVLDRIGRPPGE